MLCCPCSPHGGALGEHPPPVSLCLPSPSSLFSPTVHLCGVLHVRGLLGPVACALVPVCSDGSGTCNGWGRFTMRPMEDTTFNDLAIRVGAHYVFSHHGDCEHVLMFSDLRCAFLRVPHPPLSPPPDPLPDVCPHRPSPPHPCVGVFPDERVSGVLLWCLRGRGGRDSMGVYMRVYPRAVVVIKVGAPCALLFA